MRRLWTTAVFISVALPFTSVAQQIVMGAESAQLAGPNLHLIAPVAAGQAVADSSVATSAKPPSDNRPTYSKPFVTGFLNNFDHGDFTVKVPANGFYDLDVAFRSAGSKGEGPKKNTPEELKRIYSSPGVTTLPLPVDPKTKN